MKEENSNERLAKNTIYLYLRLGFSMIVSLFTSRVILQVLGVNDMGIQASVGGVVGFVGFLNAALSNGSSRFIVYALGKGNIDELKKTFSSVFWVHTLLAIILVIFVEIIGLWFLYHRLIIPPERLEAANWVFHLGIISMFVGITQSPYGACVVAHEKMNMYAYTGVIETILKLAIVYLLLLIPGDKLKWYSFLFFIVTILNALFYRWYCLKKFTECKLQFILDRKIIKPILQFSGWQLFANISMALNGHGILILLNMFFSPAVVAARSISIQVNSVVTQFMTNFRSAAVPQIVKSYASGDVEKSKKLNMEVAKFSYYLMLLVGLPVFLLSYDLLYIWLGEVPAYTDIFLKLIIVQSIIQVFDTSFYTPIYAKGRLRENALSAPIILFSAFPVVYILFKLGFSPISLSWAYIIAYGILSFIQKPIILIKIVGYKWNDFLPVYYNCLKVTLLSLITPLALIYFYPELSNNRIIYFFTICFVSVASVSITVYFIGMNANMRCKTKKILLKKIAIR